MITVLLADDHTIVREGLHSLLKSEEGIKVVGEVKNGREAVALTRQHSPDVLVMDIAMPLLNGLEAARQVISTSGNTTRIIFLSAYSDDAYIEKAIALGASGYLVKQSAFETLPKAIREVHSGKKHFSPVISRRMDAFRENVSGNPTPQARPLTPRETEVLQLIAEGNPNKMIAHILGISIKTVEKHRQNLMEKTALHDTASLTRHAIATGVIKSGIQVTIS